MSATKRRKQERQRAACDRDDDARIHELMAEFLEPYRAEAEQVMRELAKMPETSRERQQRIWTIRLTRAELEARERLTQPHTMAGLVGDVPLAMRQLQAERARLPDLTPQPKRQQATNAPSLAGKAPRRATAA